MIIEVQVPHVGESITEGIIASWSVEDGTIVAQDDELFELETDKVTMMVQAEHAGRIKILVEAEATVQMGQVVAQIDTEATTETPKTAEPRVPQTAGPPMNPVAGMPQARAKLSRATLDELAPAVRALVLEHQLDPEKIHGTGRDGRITKADVLAYLKRDSASNAPAPTTPPTSPPVAPAPTKPVAPQPHVPPSAPSDSNATTPTQRKETRRKMTRLRQRIAERLVSVKNDTAMLTTFNEADMSRVIELRKQYKETFVERYGVPLGFMPFFVKAVVEALKQVPEVNARIDGDEIVEHHYYDIGIAVGSDRGLVVPILRDCDQKSFAEIELEIRRLAERVRNKTITLPELTGGVFSITNGGVYGNLMSTPILNPPQSAILGMHAIKKRPVATPDDQVVVRPMMYLAVSYDHRLIDGKESVTFLKRVVECIENPERIMLQV